MLISQLVPVDPQSKQFADYHATATITPAGNSFLDYLQRVMRPQSEELPAHEQSARRSPVDDSILNTQPAQHVSDGVSASGRPATDHRATDAPTQTKRDAAIEERSTEDSARAKADKAETDAGSPDAGRADEARQVKADSSAAAEDEAAGRASGAAAAENANGSRKDAARAVAKDARGVQELKPKASGDEHALGAVAGLQDAPRARSAASAGESDVRAGEGREPWAGLAGKAEVAPRAEITVDLVDVEKGVPRPAGVAAAAGAEKRGGRQPAGGAGRAAGESGENQQRGLHAIQVRDLRGKAAAGRDEGQAGGDRDREESTEIQRARLESGDRGSSRHEQVEFVESRSAGQPAGAARLAAEQPRSSAGVLQSLREALQERVNGDIVRTARLVVRGNDSGEIRLNLRPETLGQVRISLHMQEGHIAGRIIVENASVREVFEQNLASLVKAFQESGIETGSLDVTVADSGGEGNARSGDEPARGAIRELDRAVPTVQMFEDDHELVNLVV